MKLQSNQLLTAAKAFSRGNDIPLDPTSIFTSYEELLDYVQNDPTAYDLQLVTVRDGDDIENYVLSKNSDGEFEILGCGLKKINELEQKINDIIDNGVGGTEWETF